MIDCFLPMAGAEELAKTIHSLKEQNEVARIVVMQTGADKSPSGCDTLTIDTLKSSRTVRASASGQRQRAAPATARARYRRSASTPATTVSGATTQPSAM